MVSTLVRRLLRETPPPELHTDLPERDDHPALTATPPSAPARLEAIARDCIRLAAIGPHLNHLATELEKRANEQAQRATRAAAMMARLTSDLEQAVETLRANSKQVGDALETVENLAQHTRILSINASIEATRAGIHGKSFAVIVEEVKRLADRSGTSTGVIERRMVEMQSSILRVAEVAAHEDKAAVDKTSASIGNANMEVRGMAQLSTGQLNDAKSVLLSSHAINQLSESLLLTIGTFRFSTQQKAEAQLALVLAELQTLAGDREGIEQAVCTWLERHPCFELAYVTDCHGIQITRNLSRRGGRIELEESGFRKDWSSRPWYVEATTTTGVCSTDLYRSSATQNYCFTVTAAVRQPSGELSCVIGADVNFQRLLDTDGS